MIRSLEILELLAYWNTLSRLPGWELRSALRAFAKDHGVALFRDATRRAAIRQLLTAFSWTI